MFSFFKRNKKREKPLGCITAIANHKGGVGKTTTCVNLAASLAHLKQKVLLIDLDPQGNATMGSGIDKNNIEWSMNDVLQEQVELELVLVQTKANYYILPANSDLTAAEVALLKKPKQERTLEKILQKIYKKFDYILIDCPPTLNMLTLNALIAAKSVIIPMQCEYYALEGLSALTSTITQLQQNLNPSLRIEGIIRTMHDPRNRLSLDVSKQLIENFGKKVFKAVIPRNVRLAEAPSYGLPIILYDKNSKGSLAYLNMAKELIKNSEALQKVKKSTESTV
ncbi:MAG: chromosome partitioning protein [Francisellaceae bacterium]|nr:chromosome partitioning protein [Francisellaceae bacterium]